MKGRIFLTSYRALCRNQAGREAIENYDIPPFVDSSCRREPDFEATYPSISALCRASKFAPRLKENDRVVYITKKGSYLSVSKPHWRFVAVLEVIKRFEMHKAAAEWYLQKGLKLPNNCMVDGNPPNNLDKTDKHQDSLEEWDRGYKARARLWGTFLACKPIFIELNNPAVIFPEQMKEIFGKIPGTRTPPEITAEQYKNLLRNFSKGLKP
jgi:hypothetical protein